MDPDLAESANCRSGSWPKAYQEFNASLAEKFDADGTATCRFGDKRAMFAHLPQPERNIQSISMPGFSLFTISNFDSITQIEKLLCV